MMEKVVKFWMENFFWIFFVIIGVLLLSAYHFVIVEIPKKEQACASQGWSLYITGKDYFCIDKEGRIYRVPL